MAANDLVKPFKLESDPDLDMYPTEMDPTEDVALVGGIAIEDAGTYIKKDTSTGAGGMVFKDQNNSEKTLTDLCAAGTDEKAGVSTTDTNPTYLENKLSNNGNVQFTKENAGGDETLKADVDVGVADLNDVSMATGEPSDGDILKYDLASGKWKPAEESGGGGSGFSSFHFFADQLLTPNNPNWAVNSHALTFKDTNNTTLRVRKFDDSGEEGVGFIIEIPTGATNIILNFRSRAETAPASDKTVNLKLYVKEIPDNGAVEAWSSGTALTALTIPTNEYFQSDSQTIALSTLSLTAGSVVQMELTRLGTGTLVDDWDLLLLKVEFS